MGDMERSAGQSLAAAQAARSSYNQPAMASPDQQTGRVDSDPDRRRGWMQPDDPERACTLSIYPFYLRTVLGILRLAELVLGVIVVSTANGEQCVTGALCGSPTSPMWYGELGGQGYVLFVGVIFILGNAVLIVYHLLTSPATLTSSKSENVRLGELVYNGAALLFYIIAGSVEAWYAGWTTITVRVGPDASAFPATVWNPYRPQWIAAAVFAWFNVLAYAADIVYMYFFDGVEANPSN